MTDKTNKIQRVCIFCGSADGVNKDYLDAAYNIGRSLAKSGYELVYGAGKTGLMGYVADGVLNAGGNVTGVVPSHLNTPQLIHLGLTRLEIVQNMHQRKSRMSELADAFIALPGGYGTFEELFEILTWAQLGLHAKPIGLLNIRNYFDPLIEMVGHALSEGFIYDEHRTLLLTSSDPDELLTLLDKYIVPGNLNRWVNR